MIPIKLTIKGLYSYREQVEIDFEKLAEGHLFGIFGAVGSGKSAILEAITFALYGKTERLNSSGDNRNYNMMNLQSQELLIELEFKTLVSGKEERYIFRVKQSRNSKKFEDVKTATRSALRWTGTEWEPQATTDATGILKLSYDNFIKTIIIPQGKFQDFLHLGATDRTRMLREIFSLDRFELDRPTKILLAETREQLVRLEEQLLPLIAASAEEIATQQAEHEAIAMALAQAKVQEEQLQLASNLHRQRKELSEKIAAARLQLQALEADKAAFADRAEQLARYQKARLEFSELLSQTDRLEREWKAADLAATQARASLTQLEPQLTSAQQAATLAKTAWEQRGTIEAQIQDCSNWVKVREADAELAKLEARLSNGDAVLQKAVVDVQAQLTAITAAEAQIAAEKANLPDLATIGEVLIWFQQKDQLGQQLAQVDAQRVAAAQHALQMQAELQALAVSQPSIAFAEILPALQAALSATKAQINNARDQRDHIARQGGLGAFALDLKPGEPCPLCGADHHPAPYDSGQSAQQLAAMSVQLAQLEQQQSVEEKKLQVAQTISIRLEENAKQAQQLMLSHDGVQSQLQQHLQAFRWPQYNVDDPARVEADRKMAMETQARIAKTEQTLSDLRKAAAKLQEDQKKFEAAIAQIREDKNRWVGQRAAHRQQLTVLLSPEHEAMPADALLALSLKLQSHLAALQSNLEVTQKAEKNLEIQLAEWRQKSNASASDRDRLAAEFQAAQAQLMARLAPSEFADVAALRAILARQLDAEREQAAIQQFQNNLLALQATVKTLEEQLQTQQYDAAAHEQAEQDLAALRLHVEQQQQAHSRLGDLIARLQAALARRTELEAKQRVLQKRQDNLKLLEGMFKASGFVKYVSTIYLEDLVKRADVRFRKLTRNALSLELGDESEFLVRDMLNGGQTRSVKTLSGGQTFQASLCMALALADNVQQYNGSSHNFFFLDEGFGTLDKESLIAVFEALKQLRQENRIVGVISHVEDLQQEIETHLKVWQTEARGSLVQGSWE